MRIGTTSALIQLRREIDGQPDIAEERSSFDFCEGPKIEFTRKAENLVASVEEIKVAKLDISVETIEDKIQPVKTGRK